MRCCCFMPQLFSLIAFATMMSLSGYSNEAAFGFEVFCAWATFLYVLAILPAHVFDLHSRAAWLYMVELGLDILFTLFMFIAGLAVAVKCNEENDGVKFCADYGKAKAAAAFAFLTSFMMVGSAVFSYKKYVNPPAGGYGTV